MVISDPVERIYSIPRGTYGNLTSVLRILNNKAEIETVFVSQLGRGESDELQRRIKI